MKNRINAINRRAFLAACAGSAGALALTGSTPSSSNLSNGSELANPLSAPFITRTTTPSDSQKSKKLFATTDFYDNVLLHDVFYTRAQMDDMNRALTALGVTRHQWVLDLVGIMYDDYPHGFDLLAEAVESAHAHGLEFYAVFKPFEAGGYEPILPHTMPCPERTAFEDLRGIFPSASPYLVSQTEMCMKRKSGTYEYRGPVKAVRLVKGDDEPTRVKKEHLTLWTSATNNHFKPYKGPVSFRETVEWRPSFPVWKKCRILHLENLQISEDQTFVMVRCSIADKQGDFTNEIGQIIELAGPDGENMPITPAKRPGSLESLNQGYFNVEALKEIMRYIRHPEVQREIKDPEKMKNHCRDFFDFSEHNLTNLKTLDSDLGVRIRLAGKPFEFKLRNQKTNNPEGYIAVACGKPEYMLGNPHPIYPEVRREWLDVTKYCLDRGVDGVNFRAHQHTMFRDYWEYGYNEPVIRATGGRTDHASVSRINGDAFTSFLREAKDLIKSRDKGMMLHLHPDFIIPDDRGKATPLPPNFEWQWETWIKEIADEFEYRGNFMMRPWNNEMILDMFSSKTREAGKPLFYQGTFKMKTDEGRKIVTQHEIDIVKNHPGLDGYNLYETAYFMTRDKEDKIVSKPYVQEVIHEHFWK